ncbi:hypothetical protein OROGR_004366 [Orobanche gracilis]
MDSLTFHDIRFEKANAISTYRRTQKITTLFRLVELLFFMIVVSRFSVQFATSLKASGECFRGINVAVISPRFVFLLGNVIVIVLFLKSRRFSAKNGEIKIADDIYQEHVEKCRKINSRKLEEKKASEARRKLIRFPSENLERERRHGEERRRYLPRSVTEARRKSPNSRRKSEAGVSAAEDDMSSEEFRRTVEAFIARQQRFLREE